MVVILSNTINQNTVNSEIFARTLFSRNFAYAKFRENKTLDKLQNHSVVICKPCLSGEFFTSLICRLILFAKKKSRENFRIYSMAFKAVKSVQLDQWQFSCHQI